MILYNTEDSENVINKELTLKHELSIKFKQTINISSPVIRLQLNETVNIMECNYCYIEEFSRYYFIRDIEVDEKNVCNLYLECDVVESFKDDILSSYAEYTATISEGDFMEVRGTGNVRKVIEVYESDKTITPNKTLILTTIGG